MPHATQMSADDTGLLVIDVQVKLVPLIPEADRMVRNVAFLVDAARVLNMPVQCTEQYPRGLGTTVPELAERLPQRPEKVAFSSCAVPGVVDQFHEGARPKIDHDIALRRLEQAGAILTTSEGCVFEWIGGASHPQFKAVSALVQQRMKQM
jgi:nicotinamidase-related amidase